MYGGEKIVKHLFPISVPYDFYWVGLTKTVSSNTRCVNSDCNGGKLTWADGTEFNEFGSVFSTVVLNGNEPNIFADQITNLVDYPWSNSFKRFTVCDVDCVPYN